MNSNEFICEVKTSKLNYLEFDEEYEGFQKYQRLVLDALKEFHRVCELNSIPYQLAYGSLLGAIRDNGQIPWDYDADVFVPYCEKNRLIEALDRDLSKEFYYMSPEADRKCRHFFIRLAPKGYRSEAFHLDVFYVIGAPDVDSLAFGKQVRRLISIRFFKLVNIRMEHNNLKQSIKWILQKIRYSIISIRKIEREFRELCSKYDFYSSENELITDSYSDRQLFNSKMWDTMMIDTAAGTFRISKYYGEILTYLYGAYSEVHPLNERIQEFRKAYRRIKSFEKRW